MRTLVVSLIFSLTTLATAQINPDLYSGLKWRSIGPFRAGRVTAVQGIPSQPSVYYIGTPGGGIWKTNDAGSTWKPIFDAAHVASIGGLAVSPSNPQIIYAGTGEQTIGNGVWKSSDAGATWTNVGLAETHFISDVLVDPQNPDIVLVGASGDFAPGPNRGVFKSTDGGKSWSKTLFVDDSTAVVDICFDPNNPRTLLAAVQRRTSFGGGNRGAAQAQQGPSIYKSTDEGSTWAPVAEKGLPDSGRGRVGVAIAPKSNGQRMFAIVTQGLFRSDDGGQTWQKSTTDPRIIGSGYFSRLFPDPQNPDILYVAQTTMYRSTDGGKTFDGFYGAPSGDDIHLIWINPRDTRHMILGIDQGGIVSENGGETWTSWYNQATGQFYHVSTDNQWPYWIYAAQQDSGSIATASRSDYGEITYREWYSPSAFEVAYIAVDPLDANIVYSTGWYGTVVRLDHRTGQVRHVFARTEKYQTGTADPLMFSPHDPRALYLGAQMLLKSTDGGLTWHEASPALGKPAQQGGPARANNHFISALSFSTAKAGVIWAGTGDGNIQITVDDGAHWQNVAPPQMPAGTGVSTLDASHHDPLTAYAAVNGARDMHPYIFRTRDGGKSWQPVVQGLPESTIVRVVRADTVRKGLLYAGTETGVWCSFDDGDHWQPLQLNLPTTSVRDLDQHGDDLVAATFGRSLWVLDDLSPLRQLNANATATLFQPQIATRWRWDMNEDTPLPKETPAGENPPDGAILNYFLPSAPAGEITLDIFDAQHRPVRHYSSTPPPEQKLFANAPSYWFAAPPVLSRNAGVNRFVWDLRYPSPPALTYGYFGELLDYVEYTLADYAIPGKTPVDQPQGPLAAPGQYEAVLTVDGKQYRQTLTVRPDPRVHATAADYSAQLALEQRADSGMTATYNVFHQAQALAQAIPTRSQSLAVNDATKPLLQSLGTLADTAANVMNGVPGFDGVGPLNRDFGRLAWMAGTGDGPVAQTLVTSVDEMCSSLAKALDTWKQANTTTIPQVNQQLQQHGAAALPVVREIPGGCGK
jgi:photosystem II stability/assembly factor-like uncharacterized protein